MALSDADVQKQVSVLNSPISLGCPLSNLRSVYGALLDMVNERKAG